MTVILEGHDYKYAVEQMLLTLFPEERPAYGTQEENRVTVTLRRGGTWLTATAVLCWKGRVTRHACRAKVSELTGDPLADGRVCQRHRQALPFTGRAWEALGPGAALGRHDRCTSGKDPHQGHAGRGYPGTG